MASTTFYFENIFYLIIIIIWKEKILILDSKVWRFWYGMAFFHFFFSIYIYKYILKFNQWILIQSIEFWGKQQWIKNLKLNL